MATLVYFSFPAHGHVNPTLPVVRELVSRGESVIYYTTKPFEDAVCQSGARFCAYSRRIRMPEHGPGPFAHVSTTLETLLEFSRAVLDDHLAEVRRLQTPQIMFDSFAPWGQMVAQLLGVPSLTSVPSILIGPEIDARYRAGAPPDDPRLTPEWCSAFRSRCQTGLRAFGLERPPSPPQFLQAYGDLNIVYTSRLFQPLAEAFDANRFQFVGPCFGFRPDPPPFPFEQLDGRPLVLVALGTVYGNDGRFFRACLQDLAGCPWQLVIATGNSLPPETLGPIPENCILRSRVPQIEILRRAAAFVTHGGMNSVQEALYHGVPMVMAPQGADQFWISARVQELGAGQVLKPCSEPGAIREAVAQAVFNPGYAAAARRIGASLRAAGGHGKAAGLIQSFVRRAAGGRRSEELCPSR